MCCVADPALLHPAMASSTDMTALASALKGLPKSRKLIGSKAASAQAAMQRVLDRPETPAARVRELGVREEVERAAKKLAAAHKLEYIMQEETSRAVVQRVEQQLKVTGQLE